MHRHPIDALSLAFGLVFVALAGALLAPGLGLATLTSPWLWPALLMLLGAALLLPGVPHRRQSTGGAPGERQDGEASIPDDDPRNL